VYQNEVSGTLCRSMTRVAAYLFLVTHSREADSLRPAVGRRGASEAVDPRGLLPYARVKGLYSATVVHVLYM